MLVSAEVRWFWPDEPPNGLFDWFVGSSHHPSVAGDPSERVDEYLRDAKQTELGIKRRGGKDGVEVKGLVAVLHEVGGEPPFRGRIEMWSKWTSSALDLSGRPTVRITKKRWLRTVAAAPSTTRGCNVEITELRLSTGERWWTFGFESFGGRTTVEDDLLAATRLMAEREPPPFPTTLAAAYPAWLATEVR
jgi:hypothetical protein